MAGTRRDNGESYISSKPNAQGYYEAKVWMGLKGNGKPDRRHVQRKDLKALKARVKQLEQMRTKGQVGQPGKVPTVQEMLERHLNVILPQRRRSPRTIADYWSKCRNDIFPRWGGQRVDRLRPEHIEDGLNDMLNNEGHAPSHVRKVLAVLSSAYELQAKRSAAYGLPGGTTLVNPCNFVEPPELGETDRKSLTVRQSRAVLVQAAKRGEFTRWAVGLSLGLRQGEALGLRWKFLDIDVPEGEAGEMRVWAQLQRLTWEHGCDDPHACGADHHRAPCPVPCPKAERTQGRKHVCPQDGGKARSASGTKGDLCPADCTAHAQYCPRRKLPRGGARLKGAGALVIRESVKEKKRKTVPIPPVVCETLREHRNSQFEQKMLAGAEWNDNDLVFSRWNGAPVDPRQDWKDWGAILEAAGVEHMGVHGGRHTALTIAIDEGVAITAVQQLAGHSSVKTTEGYDHSSSPGARIAARAVSRALFEDPE
jgi:integrase